MQLRQRLIELRSFDNRWLKGVMILPPNPSGGVILVDGTASGRLGTFLNSVAERIASKGLATLVVDALVDDESVVEDKRFDIELLSSRIQAAADGLSREVKTPGVRLGYFGMGVGSAAVLVAAAQRKSLVGGVVCYANKTKLAENYRSRVVAPVLILDESPQDTAEQIGETASEWFLQHPRAFASGGII